MSPRKNVSKRDSRMFSFDGEKEKTMDKIIFATSVNLKE